MKKILFSLFFFTSLTFVYSQELHLFDNIQNPMQFNPAATGLIYENRIASSTEFWTPSFEGTPLTTQINYEKSIDSTTFGFGILGMYDKIGFTDSQFLSGIFRYSIVNKPHLKLALGMAIRYSTFHLNPTWYIPDESFTIEDPAIPDEHRSHYFNFSPGIWAKTERLNAGISLDSKLLNLTNSNNLFSYNYQFYAYFSYKILNSTNFILQPEFIYVSDGSYDVQFYGINATINKNYRLGLKMRNDIHFAPSIGYSFRNISIDASAEFANNLIFQAITGIQLAYSFN